MTERDAINELKELKEYLLLEERIEAVDTAIAALEKQIQKKATRLKSPFLHGAICPRIDWSEVEDD